MIEILEKRQLFSVTYTLVDLGIPAGYQSLSGTGLNNSGQVSATAEASKGYTAGLIYKAGKLQLIPGADNANAINDKGQVAGEFSATYDVKINLAIKGGAVTGKDFGDYLG